MISAKQKILNALTKSADATLTVAQAKARFKIANVSARVNELRKDGHNIVTQVKISKNGTKSYFYRLMPSTIRKGKSTKA
jgi:hypothetical protein